MKVAIVHEWLDTWAGSEQVLAEMLEVFPQARLYALVDFLSSEHREKLGGRYAQTSFLQHLPGARRHFRKFLPLMPLAVEQFDLRGFDVVISNSHAVAKGVITGPDQVHLCYCYSPPRYAWDLQDTYLGRGSWLKRALLHRFRIWDVAASLRPDRYFAISHFIARRIEKCYRRQAEVIYPPLDTEWFTPGGARGQHYFSHSRFVPYKRLEILVEAFGALPERVLRLAGDGPGRKKLQARAPANVQFLGHIDRNALREELRSARAYLFAAEEDFGLAPLEAMACGTPVIAFGRGGVWETLRDAPDCVFFGEQTPGCVSEAVIRFEQTPETHSPQQRRAAVTRLSRETFRTQMRAAAEIALGEERRKQGRRGNSG